MRNLIEDAIILRGYNVGCISNINKLNKKQVKHIIKCINEGMYPCSIQFKENNLMCEIEYPFCNNELDVTVKDSDYYN